MNLNRLNFSQAIITEILMALFAFSVLFALLDFITIWTANHSSIGFGFQSLFLSVSFHNSAINAWMSCVRLVGANLISAVFAGPFLVLETL